MSWIIDSLEKQLAEMQTLKQDIERKYIDINESINAMIAVIDKMKFHDSGVAELSTNTDTTIPYPTTMYIE